MRLTAAQIRQFDEIAFDRASSNNTLKIALTYHSNRENELQRAEVELWDELAEIHNLDFHNNKYEIQQHEGSMQIMLIPRPK